MIKMPTVTIQEIDLCKAVFSNNNLYPNDEDLRIELHRRLKKFINKPNTEKAREAIVRTCREFHDELWIRFPGYFGQFGFDIKYDNGTYTLSPYAKNIRTLLAIMGYMMYALDCPEDAETYSCSIGNFKVVDGRSIQLADKE